MALQNSSPEESAILGAILAAPRLLRLAALGCVLAIPLVLVLGREGTPTVEAAVSLGVAAFLTLGLAELERRPNVSGDPRPRALVLFMVGLALMPVGWFFGPHTEFAGVITLVLLILGVASAPTRAPLSWLPAWAGAAGLVGGLTAVTLGMVFGGLRHASLVPLFRAEAPSVFGQGLSALLVFGWVLLGFLAARRFRDRYHALALEVDQAARASAVRDALLDEARYEYMEALSAARIGRPDALPEADAATVVDDAASAWDELERTVRVAATQSARAAPEPPTLLLPAARALHEEATQPIARDSQPSQSQPSQPSDSQPSDSQPSQPGQRRPRRSKRPASRRPPPPDSAGWAAAFLGKVAVLQIFVVLGSLSGIAAAYFILPDRVALIRAVLGMTVSGALALLHVWLQRRSGRHTVHWPWVLIAASSVVVVTSYGLHSAIVAAIVVIVFLGGLFRGIDDASGLNSRSAFRVSFVSLSASYFGAFVVLSSGLVEDRGSIPLRSPAMPFFEPMLHHLITQGTFIAAFVVSGVIDRSFRSLRDRSTEAANEAAVQEALLATATAKLTQLAAASPEGLFAGQTIGRFTLGARRASGGMGEVYDAVDPLTSERAALKLVRVDVVSDPRVLQHFAHEVIALRRVQSPFVAKVLDAGGLESGLPYVAMELIEGPTLGDLLRRERAFPLDELRRLVRDVTSGLSAIHQSAVVHRDIKPQNIVRGSARADAPWKIVDLGIAHIEGVVRSEVNFRVVGTPRYMAPEQFVGAVVDARTDLFALALVLYRVLTGRPAFRAARVGADGRLLSPPPPAWPEDVSLFLRIGTATRPEDRFPDAESFHDAFVAATEGRLPEPTRRQARELLEREPWSKPDGGPP